MKGDGWHKTDIGVKTRYAKGGQGTFDAESKINDAGKIAFNTLCVMYAKDLTAYFLFLGAKPDESRMLNTLLLDARYLYTSTRLHQEAEIPLNCLTIVSNEVQFSCEDLRKSTKPTTHTENLSDVVGMIPDMKPLHEAKRKPLNPPRFKDIPFDVLILDFCSSISKETKTAIKEIFRKQLVEDLSVVAFTYSIRYGKSETVGDEPVKEDVKRQMDFDGFEYFRRVADKHGFSIGTITRIKYDLIVSYIFKMAHRDRSMSVTVGVNSTKVNAADWCFEPVDGINLIKGEDGKCYEPTERDSDESNRSKKTRKIRE